MTPNWFATIALILWPAVALYVYATRPIGQATLWTILGALLLLPVGASIKFDMIPGLDKNSIPNLAALIGCILVARRPPRLLHRFEVTEVLICVLLVSPFATSLLNGDAIQIGPTTLPGVGAYDALSAVVFQYIFFIPFILGRQYLRSASDNAYVLRTMVVAGLAYSLPMLFEIRMSPHLHEWVYGYQAHTFSQQVRDGGFRPVVFLGHGLLVAFFAMSTVVAAAALWRTQTRVARLPCAGVLVYLSGVLALCKTLGALIYGVALVPLVCWTKPRFQIRVATVLVAVALTYPLLRTVDLVPTTFLLDTANSISADRADSLRVRFEQEGALLKRASERIWFGWGRWGRSRIYDPEYGTDVTESDGHWIITMGTFGVVGFLAEFGLLVLPVFRAAAALKFAESTNDRVFLAALALIVAISVVDLLPNASISPWTWLLAGALLGRAEALHATARQRAPHWNVNSGIIGSDSRSQTAGGLQRRLR